MADDKSHLKDLRKKYKELQEKYNLPPFEELNREFYIEKAESETEFFTREIRRLIADKVFNYLRFVETLINPVNAPMFIFSVIKSITPEDKKNLTKIYEKLSEANLELIKLDIGFTESEDAEFIKSFYDSWQTLKIDFLETMNKVKSMGETKVNPGNNGYFG